LRPKSGFSLVEVIVASSVLVVALFGIMAAAFQSYKRSDVGDEYMTASLLCAERLDYFRSQRDPYRAVGGTWYEPPADPKREVDFNTDPQVHLIANETPILFVREFVVASTENRYKAGAVDVGKLAQGNRNGTTPLERVNWIPDTPDRVPNGLPNAGQRVDVVLPNGDCTNFGVPASQPLTATGPIPTVLGPPIPGFPTTRVFNFLKAPRCNERLRLDPALTAINMRSADQILDVPPAVRYIREVWVQTHHPLGRAFAAGGPGSGNRTGIDDTYPGAVQPTPGFYGLAAAAPGLGCNYNQIPRVVIARAAGSGNTSTGASRALIAPYVVAVTVRTFLRNPRVRTLVPSGNTVDGSVDVNGFKAGMGYDPARPLATMTGYFGLRRYLQ
jgi:hypothetical protein